MSVGMLVGASVTLLFFFINFVPLSHFRSIKSTLVILNVILALDLQVLALLRLEYAYAFAEEQTDELGLYVFTRLPKSGLDSLKMS